MAKIKFENGVTINFEGNPTQKDIDEISKNIGVGSENPNATKGVLDAFVKGAKNIKESVVKSGQELDETLNTPTTTPAGTLAKYVKTATGLLATYLLYVSIVFFAVSVSIPA